MRSFLGEIQTSNLFKIRKWRLQPQKVKRHPTSLSRFQGIRMSHHFSVPVQACVAGQGWNAHTSTSATRTLWQRKSWRSTDAGTDKQRCWWAKPQRAFSWQNRRLNWKIDAREQRHQQHDEMTPRGNKRAHCCITGWATAASLENYERCQITVFITYY